MTKPTVMAANMTGIICSVKIRIQCGLKPDEDLEDLPGEVNNGSVTLGYSSPFEL